jgi:ASC-1-like (ASCH) protein
MDRMLQEFQDFWRQNSELWESKTKTGYTEAFPHLLLMAFLQRTLNGRGHIERDCAAGRGRMDLSIEFNGFRYIIEIKLLRSYHSPAAFRKKGLEQIMIYRDKFDKQTPAYLVIFDRRPESKSKNWDERITWEQEDEVTVLGC